MNEIREKQITVGDRRSMISDVLVDAATDLPIDLTGHTVAFRMYTEAGAVKVSDAAATVVTPASGVVGYAPTAADVDTAGTYFYWWIVTRTSDSKKETFPSDGRKRRLVIYAAQ